MRNAAARLAGQDDIEALNALADGRRDLRLLAGELKLMLIEHPLPLRLYGQVRGYDLDRVVRILARLSNSLIAPNQSCLLDRAIIGTALKLNLRDFAVDPAQADLPKRQSALQRSAANTTRF